MPGISGLEWLYPVEIMNVEEYEEASAGNYSR